MVPWFSFRFVLFCFVLFRFDLEKFEFSKLTKRSLMTWNLLWNLSFTFADVWWISARKSLLTVILSTLLISMIPLPINLQGRMRRKREIELLLLSEKWKEKKRKENWNPLFIWLLLIKSLGFSRENIFCPFTSIFWKKKEENFCIFTSKWWWRKRSYQMSDVKFLEFEEHFLFFKKGDRKRRKI